MKRSIQPLVTNEAMVSPRQSAELLPLPRYWFTSPQLRARYRTPHYLLVGLVRFHLSELTAWASQCAISTGEHA